jgi:hypothetical protein
MSSFDFFEDFYPGLGKVAFATLAILLVAFLVLVPKRPAPAPPPQDAVDGTYTNEACPGFEITNGTITFNGGEIEGRVVDIKGYVLETARALRYRRDGSGCRLVASPGGQLLSAERKTFASPVIMLYLSSVDRDRGMYWTRTGPPRARPSDVQEQMRQ